MRVLVGVCGGIAAYKAAEIVRALQDRGAQVEVAMTAAAQRFITPLTFNALTGRPVHTTLWSPDQAQQANGPIEHIAVAEAIDVLLVAPASATTLARFAHGFADDFLSATYLATSARVILAPAMNVNMWQHPATQANLALLTTRGAVVVEPEAGYLACGAIGSGRLANITAIVEAALSTNTRPQDLLGETVLITAGGTREPVDPVRYLGNRSSGRMGYALAEAAEQRGAHVILISASTLPAPTRCELVRVETTEDMHRAMSASLPRATMLIAAAAVADFRPAAPSSAKLRRAGSLTLQLEPTPDLVAWAVANRELGTLVIAFAAETEDLEANARLKLLRKGADALVANNVAEPGTGFDSENNAGLFLTPASTVALPLESKRAMADRVLDQVVTLRHTKDTTDAANARDLNGATLSS